MKIKITLKDERLKNNDVDNWLKNLEDKFNKSKLIKQRMLQMIMTGSSTITDEEIIAEIKNERS